VLRLPVVIQRLSLEAVLCCYRSCKAWKQAVEQQGFDYGVATLCVELADPEGVGRVKVQLAGSPDRGAGRQAEVLAFISHNTEPGSWRSLAGVWLNRAMLERDDGWVCEGAMRCQWALVGGDAGWTELHSRAVLGSGEEVERLLQSGCDCDAKAGDGATALHLSARKGNLATATALVTKGNADGNARDASNHTPVDYAAGRGHLEVVKLLFKDRGGKIGRTALFAASENGHLEVVKHLGEMGGKELIMAKNKDGRTALFWASQEGHLEVVKHLGEMGGKELIMAKNTAGKTAEDCARKGSEVEMYLKQLSAQE